MLFYFTKKYTSSKYNPKYIYWILIKSTVKNKINLMMQVLCVIKTTVFDLLKEKIKCVEKY